MHDFFYHKEHLFIVCELLRDNLYEFSKFNREEARRPYFTLPRLRRISRQCLAALRYIHSLNLIHCDLKPENILIKSYSRCEVKDRLWVVVLPPTTSRATCSRAPTAPTK